MNIIYYIGKNQKHHRSAEDIEKSFKKSGLLFGLLHLQLQENPNNTNMLQIYASTINKPNAVIGQFYSDRQGLKQLMKKVEKTI